MVIEGNSPGTFFSGVRMDVRMDGRMDVSRVVDRDRITALDRKGYHEQKKEKASD